MKKQYMPVPTNTASLIYPTKDENININKEMWTIYIMAKKVTSKKISGIANVNIVANKKKAPKLSKIKDTGLEFDLSRTGDLELNQPETQDDQNLLEIEDEGETEIVEDDQEAGEDKLDDDNEYDEENEKEEEEEDAGEDESNDQGDDEGCLYNFAKRGAKSNIDDGDENLEDEEVYDDDDETHDMIVKDEDRITKRLMTIYERVRLLGDRSRQLLGGAKPMVKDVGTKGAREIAQLELINGVMPLKVKRKLPNGKIEIWKPSELQIIN